MEKKNHKNMQESHFQISILTFLTLFITSACMSDIVQKNVLCFGDLFCLFFCEGKPFLSSFYFHPHKHNSKYIQYTIHTIPRQVGLYKVFQRNFSSSVADKLPVCSANSFWMVTLGSNRKGCQGRTEVETRWRERGGTARWEMKEIYGWKAAEKKQNSRGG